MPTTGLFRSPSNGTALIERGFNKCSHCHLVERRHQSGFVHSSFLFEFTPELIGFLDFGGEL